MRLLASTLILLLPVSILAQEANPTQSADRQVNTNGPVPIFKVQVVSRSTQAVSYQNRSGWTRIDFQGTSLAPKAEGRADVNSRLGHMEIKLDVKHLPSARTFGPLFLTYVLWAITPDGHASNLGEVVVDSDGNFKGDITTGLQAFGLIITAEPYFAVRQPSDVVVMENVIRQDTKGKWEVVNAKYELLPRGQYTYHVPAEQLHPVDLNSDKKSPLEIYEAINAVQIAKYAKADQYAGDIYQDATNLLNQAQDYKARKQWNPAIMTSKEAVQKAEDARIVSLRKQQQLALDQERQEAADRQAAARKAAEQAQLQAEQAAQQRQQAEAQRQQAEEQARLEAQHRAEAEQAQAEAAAQAKKAQEAAAEADRLRMQAEQEKTALRERLLQQFNSVLPTHETPRGLVVNMQDVLFDTAKYTLKEPAKLALARIAGIVVSHPGLNLQIEGYTDSTGTADFNQKLSEQRANAVRDFLMGQGLNTQNMTAVGYGENYPVAPNDTAAGRQLNRRVELVISGEIIGVKIGTPPSANPTSGAGVNPPVK
ncbi:MAG TPA: OmpA family protein [Bryobacteraceae bacterium]|nr:OmpA family protein [Bryobacteraceae bacterium]